MGFFAKPKKPPPPPNTPILAKDTFQEPELLPGAGSLISTSAQGLRRKASTERVSLIGG